jgi:hypothetical protein
MTVNRPAGPRRLGRRVAVALALVLAVGASVLGPRLRHDSKRDDANTSTVATSPSATGPTWSAQTFDTSGGPPVPTNGAYVGAWVFPEPFDQRGRVSAVRRFESQIGTRLRLVHIYRSWTDPIGTSSDLAFAKRGSYLQISWATPDLKLVTDGSQDKLIAQRARQIKALPTKVLLQIRWEMDRPNLRHVIHDPATFIAAWHHIRAIFIKQHVTNVGWTWCPTAAGFADGTAQTFYPGDGEVDWICADVYPVEPWIKGKYESFPMLAQAFLTWAAAHPTKPILIGEMGVSVTYGARRPRWISEAQQYISTHPQIKGISWFDENKPDSPAYYALALHDPPSLAAFASLAQNPYFQP